MPLDIEAAIKQKSLITLIFIIRLAFSQATITET